MTSPPRSIGAHPRVVVLTPYFRPLMGGVESNAERLALFLRTAGFEVTVLTKRLTRDLPDADATDHVRQALRRTGGRRQKRVGLGAPALPDPPR